MSTTPSGIVDASGAIHGADGRFAGHVSTESAVTLDDLLDTSTEQGRAILEKDRATQRQLRLLTIDPVTGYCPPVYDGGYDVVNTPVDQLPLSGRAALSIQIQARWGDAVDRDMDAAQRMVEQVESHEAHGGTIDRTRGHFGANSHNVRHAITWRRPDGALGIAGPVAEPATEFERNYRETHGVPVQFVSDEDWDFHDGNAPHYAEYEGAVQMPDGTVLRSTVTQGEERDLHFFERALPGGGSHTWSADDGVTEDDYRDAMNLPHNDSGPAWIGKTSIRYASHGVTHRKRADGPASIDRFGNCEYVDRGWVVNPDDLPADLLERHGVIREPDRHGNSRLRVAGLDGSPEHKNLADYFHEGRLP